MAGVGVGLLDRMPLERGGNWEERRRRVDVGS